MGQTSPMRTTRRCKLFQTDLSSLKYFMGRCFDFSHLTPSSWSSTATPFLARWSRGSRQEAKRPESWWRTESALIGTGSAARPSPPLLPMCSTSPLTPCAENDKINVIDERYFGTHILGNNLPFQTSEIPKKNTQPLISIRGLAFNGLLRSSEKWKFQDTVLESV